METKPLLYGIIGFILGGLLVSIVATTQDETEDNKTQTTSTAQHNQTMTDSLKSLKGDDFDKAFIEGMIDHHQGAIDMAKLTEANAKHDEIKKLGQDIISAQTSEIDMMKGWQQDWGYTKSPMPKDMPMMH